MRDIRLFFRGVLAIFIATTASAVLASAYPNKPIKLIVPWPAGGLVDRIARELGSEMSKDLGQPIVVSNIKGAAGNIGASQVANASPDGHTLLLTTSALTISTALKVKIPFDAVLDLQRVSLAAYSPGILVVSESNSIKSVKDLINAAHSKPGSLSYASSGVGSPAHLLGELFKYREKIFVLHVPYPGAPPAMMDQIAGRVDFHFANAAVAFPQIKAGKVRALAVTSPSRMPFLPNVPTMAEAGIPKFEIEQWIGLLAPKGVPIEVVNRLNGSANKILNSAKFKNSMVKAGMRSAEPDSPKGFDRIFKEELNLWMELVDSVKLTAK